MYGSGSAAVRFLLLLAAAAHWPSTAHAQDAFVAWVASYRSMENARAGLQVLKTKDPDFFSKLTPHIHEIDLAEKGTWYRLQFGPPRSRDEVNLVCEKIKALSQSDCKIATPFNVVGKSSGHTGTLVLKPLSDGENMTTVEPVEFVDSQGRRWVVPSGTRTDGASIPRPLWSIVGSPFTGLYLKASVIHDHYVRTKDRSWMDTHDVFYEAMIASSVGKKQALLMWAAVYRFGPRWAKNESRCWGTCAGSAVLINIDVTLHPEFAAKDFDIIKAHLGSAGDDLGQLKEFIDQQASNSSRAKLTGWVTRMSDAGKTNGVEFVSENVDESWALFGAGWRHKQHFYRVVNVPLGDTLNLRTSPSNSAKVLKTVPRNARRLTLAGGCENGWCPITFEQSSGWVASRYLTFDWELSPQQQ